jgi:hypothetical protein
MKRTITFIILKDKPATGETVRTFELSTELRIHHDNNGNITALGTKKLNQYQLCFEPLNL